MIKKEELNITEETTLTITRHAKERYAERVANQEELSDIGQYITLHEDKIAERIAKMVYYGDLIYSGKLREHEYAHIFLQDTWIVICDRQLDKVITLYKVSLGCADENIDKAFVKDIFDQVQESRGLIESIETSKMIDNKECREKITLAENRIKDLKKQIENEEMYINIQNDSIKYNQSSQSTEENKLKFLVSKLTSNDRLF